MPSAPIFFEKLKEDRRPPRPVSRTSHPRERTDNKLVAAATLSWWGSGPVNNGGGLYGYTSPQGEQRGMTDVVQDDFKHRIASGEVIFNPMSSYRWTLTSVGQNLITEQVSPSYAAGQKYGYNGDYFLGHIGGIVPTQATAMHSALKPTSIETMPYNRAIAEAVTGAQRYPSDANLLVSLAEADKTRRLVPDLLNNWKRLFQRLNQDVKLSRHMSELQSAKRVSAANLKSLERTATETWLAIRFGVRPLIMDTLGVLKAMKQSYENSPVRITQRGKSVESISDVQNAFFDDGPFYRVNYTRSRNHSLNVRAMNLWEVKMDMLRNAGVSLSAIPEAYIDLVRFSFVVNWVINVNDFFASLGAIADPGLTSLGGCYVLEESITSTWQVTSDIHTRPDFVLLQGTQGLINSASVYKTRLVGLPSPKLVVRADPLRFTRDLRLLDAVALLRQQLRGRNVKFMREHLA